MNKSVSQFESVLSTYGDAHSFEEVFVYENIRDAKLLVRKVMFLQVYLDSSMNIVCIPINMMALWFSEPAR